MSTRVCGGLALALLLLGGCARMSMMPLHKELEKPSGAWRSHHGAPITGFVTTDGFYHRYVGRVKLDGDTLVFRGEPAYNEYGEPEHRVAAAQVTTLFGMRRSVGESTGMSVTVLVALALVATGILFLYGLGTGGLY